MRGIYRVAIGFVVIGVGFAACTPSADQPLAPHAVDAVSVSSGSASQAPHAGRGLLGLLDGTSPSFFVCQGNGGPDSGSAVIGPLGGTLNFGPHELDVPPGALLGSTRISALTLPGDTIAVAFQPQGLRFLLPATLRLSYAQCNPQPTHRVSILYVNDLLNEILDLIVSLDDPAHHRVSGEISHFSVYAIAE